MSSNSVCNHTRDKQIGLPLRSRPILLSLVWLQTELDSTQSYYHYLFGISLISFGEILQIFYSAWSPAGSICKGRVLEFCKFMSLALWKNWPDRFPWKTISNLSEIFITPLSNFTEFYRKKREKIQCQFHFCVHVDAMKCRWNLEEKG